jgi:hypothetical protein
MPMVPCPECKELEYRHKEPKAGAKRYPCTACVDKRRQREQVRKESLNKSKALRCVPCAECSNEMELPDTCAVGRAAAAARHVCGGCREKGVVTCVRPGCGVKIALPRASRQWTKSHLCGRCQATVTCTECDRPWLRLTKGRGSHKQTRCRECRRASGLDATTLYECPQCEEPCDPIEVKNGSEMYAKCAQCKHEESADVVCGDLVSLARASPYKIAAATRLAGWAQRCKDDPVYYRKYLQSIGCPQVKCAGGCGRELQLNQINRYSCTVNGKQITQDAGGNSPYVARPNSVRCKVCLGDTIAQTYLQAFQRVGRGLQPALAKGLRFVCCVWEEDVPQRHPGHMFYWHPMAIGFRAWHMAIDVTRRKECAGIVRRAEAAAHDKRRDSTGAQAVESSRAICTECGEPWLRPIQNFGRLQFRCLDCRRGPADIVGGPAEVASDMMDTDEPALPSPTQGDAQPGGFLRRVRCTRSGCDDEACDEAMHDMATSGDD